MAIETPTAIPQLRRVEYTTYALFPTTGLTVGDLAYATDTGILYRWSGAAWQSIASPPDYPQSLILAGQKYCIPGWYCAAFAARATVLGRIYYQPIFVSRATSYDRIAIWLVNNAAAGKKARLGIYGWSLGTPTTLVVDAGTVTLDAGAPAAKEIVIAQTLPRGYYFLASVADVIYDTKGMDWAQAINAPVQGFNSPLTGNAPAFGIPYADGEQGQVAAGLTTPAVAPTALDLPSYAAVWLQEV